MDNLITAVFGASHSTKTAPRHQWDYGQLLQFAGSIRLPSEFEVHFANKGTSEAARVLSDGGPVAIPNELLATGADVLAWVYIHTAADDGETVYTATIPVIPRAKPEDYEPTPVEAGLIEQAIEALNRAAERHSIAMDLDGTTLILTSEG